MPKFIKLLTSAYVNGALRHPHEGVLHLADDEADRLLANKAGEDVTADFSADDRKEVPVQQLEANAPARPDLSPVEHQANVAPTSSGVDTAPKASATGKRVNSSKAD